MSQGVQGLVALQGPCQTRSYLTRLTSLGALNPVHFRYSIIFVLQDQPT